MFPKIATLVCDEVESLNRCISVPLDSVGQEFKFVAPRPRRVGGRVGVPLETERLAQPPPFKSRTIRSWKVPAPGCVGSITCGQALRWPVWLQELNIWFNKGTTMGVCSSAEVASEASPEDVRYCEEGIAKLREDPNCESLLRKALTDEVLEEIKTRKTSSFNSTLKDVIQSGVENPDSGIGVYAPDAEAYFVFAPLFDPIIEAYHGGFGPEDKHPPSDFGDTSHMEDLDPEGKYVVSTR